MKVLDPGHHYELALLDFDPKAIDAYTTPNDLVFVKREGPNYPGNVGTYPGTTVQEVLRACCDRVRYVNKQIYHPLNEQVLGHLKAAILALEVRAAERHGRTANFDEDQAEKGTTCSKCNHVGCQGGCHS